MNQNSELSHVTCQYITCYRRILKDMILGMTKAEPSDSISRSFIVQMIPHHRAAIEMSENLLRYTTWIPLQDIAENIIEEQTKSIADMTDALDCCSLMKNPKPEQCQYLQCLHQITQTMFSRMEHACTDNQINGNFLREMIPHHEGAIRMSENALRFPICPELVPILKAIITSQRAGVQKMKHLERILCRCQPFGC